MRREEKASSDKDQQTINRMTGLMGLSSLPPPDVGYRLAISPREAAMHNEMKLMMNQHQMTVRGPPCY